MAKKIIKKDPIKKCNANSLKDFVKQENKKEKRVTRPRIDRSKPSTIPSLNHWKTKEVDEWACTDFLGYYLNKYKEIVQEEDIEFCRAKIDAFGKERGVIKKCLESYLDSKLELKNYIDFILKWWFSKDSWAKGLPGFYPLFNSTAFIKVYKGSKNTKQKTRAEVDNEFADKSSWNKYFKEKGV